MNIKTLLFTFILILVFTLPTKAQDLIFLSGFEEITNGELVLYEFNEASGSTVADTSSNGIPLNLAIENPSNTSWLGGGLSVDQATSIFSTTAASKIIDAIKLSNEISIEAWLIPNNTTQTGPARIVTLSQNGANRNFTLGQQGSAYDVRLRTTVTSINGQPSLPGSNGSAIADLTHVVYTRDNSGIRRLYINNSLDAESTVTGDFSNWDDSYRFGLANEDSDVRPWLGDFYRVAVYDHVLTVKEIAVNFANRPDVNSAPSVTNVVIEDVNGGASFIGDILTANYNYTDVDGDAEGTSLYSWFRDGVEIAAANGLLSYTLTVADAEKQIQFKVTPVAQSGFLTGLPVLSNSITVEVGNSPPVASNVSITDSNGGSAEIGDVLNGSYTYQDTDAEGTSTFRWLGDGAEISGATGLNYTLVAADDGKRIQFEVTPVAVTGALIGLPVLSNTIAVNIPLIIDRRTPDVNAIDVTRAINISIVFNNLLDASTVNATSVSLSNGGGQVATNITLNNSTITLVPPALLDASTLYTVNLQASIEDEFGTALGTAQSWSFTTGTSVATLPVNYDIVYVRYPAPSGNSNPVAIPKGEVPYEIASSADLMLLRQDGTEVVLVDCDSTCSVVDPSISYDGKTVYYAVIEGLVGGDITTDSAASSYIYKIHTDQGSPYTPIQLTFDDGFDSMLYAGNTTADHDHGSVRGVRDMSPWPLADGRIVFASNRAGLLEQDVNSASSYIKGSVQQLYVLDDHEGLANTRQLSNLHRLETGNIHAVQHPVQLKDGRILFASWQDVATKFQYGMMSLMTVHPDGSNLQQFTEPHDHKKPVEHFNTQLADEQVISVIYYSGNNYGHGILMRYPIDPLGQNFLRGSHTQVFPHNGLDVSHREFDRIGGLTITPHTNWTDDPAPDNSGKYSMPSVGPGGDLLVSYSLGSTNFVDCRSGGITGNCGHLRAGIYVIENAETAMIDNPDQLLLVKDDPDENEIWARALISYQEIHGQEKPTIINNIHQSGAEDDRLAVGEAAAIVGTSSMYNREPLNESNPDPFQSQKRRERHDGNWTIQGADAGVFTPAEIHGVRIIATPPPPYTKDYANHAEVDRYKQRNNLVEINRRYAAEHDEKWEILGEFPLVHKGTLDEQSNPDSSWVAKIPPEVPFLIQTLDANGMTLVSELTWRALKSGEDRSDCGGCHAHSEEVTPLELDTTQAGDINQAAITNVGGVADTDPKIQQGMWDLTTGSIPLYTEGGIAFTSGGAYGVEFNRDVLPIIEDKCVSCHNIGGSGAALILNGMGLNDAYGVLTNFNDTGAYVRPQRSKYIRTPQARQSLLVWAAYNQRLDGRDNNTRTEDIDYLAGSHDDQVYLDAGITPLTDAEKRMFARWVDLGSPIDFPETDGFGYTEDAWLPAINLYRPVDGQLTDDLIVGFNDANSGLNLNSVKVEYYAVAAGSTAKIDIPVSQVNIDNKNILTMPLPPAITTAIGIEFVVIVSIFDNAGNENIESVRFIVE